MTEILRCKEQSMAAEGQASLGQRKAAILVVDDEEAVRKLLRDVLSSAGFDVLEASNGTHAIRICNCSPVDLVVTDLMMRETEGIETIQAIRRILPRVPVIAMSGFWGGYIQAARYFGANAIFRKPLDIDEFLDAVRSLIGAARQA